MRLPIIVLTGIVVFLAAGVSAHAQSITSFDFESPGSTSTEPVSINNAGAVTGTYADGGGVVHGFMRDGRGGFTSFDAPGATVTRAVGINNTGTVTGFYFSGVGPHGFIRDGRGNMTSFDPPGS